MLKRTALALLAGHRPRRPRLQPIDPHEQLVLDLLRARREARPDPEVPGR